MSRWVDRAISYGSKNGACGLNCTLDGNMFEGDFLFSLNQLLTYRQYTSAHKQHWPCPNKQQALVISTVIQCGSCFVRGGRAGLDTAEAATTLPFCYPLDSTQFYTRATTFFLATVQPCNTTQCYGQSQIFFNSSGNKNDILSAE